MINDEDKMIYDEDKMVSDEDKTLKDILAEMPLEENPKEDDTEVFADIIKQEEILKVEKADDKLKTKSLYLQTNKEALNVNNNLSFENFMTCYETKQKDKKILILSLFLDSVIDMLNFIIISYSKEVKKIIEKLSYLKTEILLLKMPLYLIKLQRLMNIIILACPENKEKIYAVIEEERKMVNGKTKAKLTIFETLVNLNFGELYEYFIQDSKIIVKGWKIYYLEDAFKTLSDVIKDKKGLIQKKEVKKLEKLDKMEIETIDLENSIFE